MNALTSIRTELSELRDEFIQLLHKYYAGEESAGATASPIAAKIDKLEREEEEMINTFLDNFNTYEETINAVRTLVEVK
jgi:hypothetical protein